MNARQARFCWALSSMRWKRQCRKSLMTRRCMSASLLAKEQEEHDQRTDSMGCAVRRAARRGYGPAAGTSRYPACSAAAVRPARRSIFPAAPRCQLTRNIGSLCSSRGTRSRQSNPDTRLRHRSQGARSRPSRCRSRRQDTRTRSKTMHSSSITPNRPNPFPLRLRPPVMAHTGLLPPIMRRTQSNRR